MSLPNHPGVSRDRPRLLIIGGFPPAESPIHGGIVTECRLLLQSSLAERYELLTVDSTQRSIPEPSLITRAALAARRVSRFIALIERQRPRAVLAFTSQGASFIEKCLCTAYARLRGVPTLLLMRGGPFMDDVRSSRWYRELVRVLLRGADILPCQGEQWRRFFHDELGIEEDRLPVVHNWTAPAEYLAVPRREERTDGPLRVLFLAWVDRGKGVFDLLDAAVALWRTPGMPRFVLDVAGGGAHLEDLQQCVATAGLGDRVTLHGWVGPSPKRALYEAADVFVLPSYAEGMPNSMIETMSLGVPVIVTPVGGIPDVIRDGENGLLVAPGDVDAIQNALARLLQSAPLRRRIGEAGRRTAIEEFSLEHGVAVLEGAIRAAEARIGERAESGASMTSRNRVAPRATGREV